ncbi:flagellar hook-basal body complex protein [Desulfovibrio sp. OttesenSCG-928-C06]|nr:flagellar hook-basal body complex protein [Desulfovibrio sp. OttesenSCG-928-C06]
MMGSLYTAATGMNGLSRGLQTISNNLANTNTVGYKQSSMLFEDLMSQTINTRSNFNTNISQRGAGVRVSATRTNWEVGGFETGSTVTDMAINGKGFFGVMKDGEVLYTRAGNFRFDNQGNLMDPTGYQLLARPIVNGVTQSGVEGVKLDTLGDSGIATHPSRATSYLKMASNIGGTANNSEDSANPFFSMIQNWNGQVNPPLGSGDAGYSESVRVYDQNGDAHNLTVRYDYVGTENGSKVYEFTVGMDPTEDGSARAGTAGAGLLMSGTVTFDNTGKISGMTAFTPTGNDPSDLSAWTQAQLVDGIPSFTANFAGSGAQQISLDFGLKLNNGWNSAITSPQAGASNPSAFYETMTGTERDKTSSTANGTKQYSRQQSQDGYPEGSIADLNINSEGVITARYTNGQTQDLYQIVLYRFTSEEGLRREGGNHFSATPESGPADEGLPTEENFGGVVSTFIEQSNVDMAREFTQMIITQRGFQMNSKMVTTSDAMLQKALELKR